MSASSRREFLQTSLSAALASQLMFDPVHAAPAEKLRLATFRYDVTPPKGHSLCGGWIKPVEAYDDELEAIGFVLLGAGAPIVICAVDWTGLLNSAHIAWRTALAEAAGTTPDRVAVQCVHQHNAPFACLDAQKIVAQHPDLPAIVDVEFFGQCLERGRAAIKASLPSARPVTHIAHAQTKVEKVASNRRFLGPDGKVQHWRGSSTKNPALQELPEGLVDPYLKTVAFYDGERKIAACHYYATHPMSYYGDGRVCSEFVGIARKEFQKVQPDCTHIYFTGCAGNIAAGKYNDGTPEARKALTERIGAALNATDAELKPQPLTTVQWQTAELFGSPNPVFDIEKIRQQIADPKQPVVNRNRPSYTVAWAERCAKKIPIIVSALHLNDASLLHLPAESFLEYQLRAQTLQPERFVAVAAYGDGGPWYIPVEEAYPQGGYEVGVAFSAPEMDKNMTTALGQALGK